MYIICVYMDVEMFFVYMVMPAKMYKENINRYWMGTLTYYVIEGLHMYLHTSVLFLCSFSSTWIILAGQLMEEWSQREDDASHLPLLSYIDKEMLYTRLM